MSQLLFRTTVLDLVPFGNPGTAPDFFALRLSPPPWQNWSPGQFVMLRPEGLPGSDTGLLWGRPFSICRASNRDLAIFFQVRGRGTRVLSRLKPGDFVDVWGPLGNALEVETSAPTLLLAGGIGIAPFVGYTHMHPKPRNITLEFGHRLPLNSYPFDSLNEKISAVPHLDTGPDDLAVFIDRMDSRIREHAKENGLVLACGPTPFLRTVQRLAAKYKARAQLCLETRMACGIGACLGCVVKATLEGGAPSECASETPAPAFGTQGTTLPARSGYVQTCTCGPNFWAGSVTL